MAPSGLRRLCVFCGSSPGGADDFSLAAERLGRALAAAGIGLVYGGASVGLMGRLADSALAAGGEVVGVIPRALVDQEVAHHGLADLRIVASMHERKALMADLADGFVALPGGLGTLDELFEILTWAQLGLHGKPVGLLDVGGYFAPLLAFLDGAVAARFLAPAHRAMLLVRDDPAALLAAFRAYQPPPSFKWVDRPVR
ncbi:MAG TPA: TIGR00730 family Rossman fold protein [Candidatus Dormibacteraeota bacterium]|nr:TIGR00730 family Rossman fold protein [Candidatus Dormibacteraeota bacterium]